MSASAALFRTLLFNLLFYGLTTILAIVLLPGLLLPERPYWALITAYFRSVAVLEKYILGLDYVVAGHENLPAQGGFIVAAKHQSAYETMKLPLLFSRPVVILKQELLNLPFWGWYARKAGMIGIDRSNPKEARQKIVEGARKAAAQGRTLVIFPQGTRVGIATPAREKPYKRGICDLYEQTGLPVVPLALNSGVFWPRNAFFKRPGTVTFAFLPPLPPGLSRDALMAAIETRLEDSSGQLVRTAQTALPSLSRLASPRSGGDPS